MNVFTSLLPLRSEVDLYLFTVFSTSGKCIDQNAHCNDWASNGDCSKNPDFMRDNCPLSCSDCQQTGGE